MVFNTGSLVNSGIRGAADEAVLNNFHKISKRKASIFNPNLFSSFNKLLPVSLMAKYFLVNHLEWWAKK